MRTQNITVDHKIPGVVYGEPSEWVYLYVHGKMGCKEEALPFAEQADAMGYQVMAIDLPEHGERKNGKEKLLPWIAVPEIQAAYTYAARRWKHVCLYAVSIGAWLSIEALQQADLERVLLVSPVVKMEELIGMSDRILLLKDGGISGEFFRRDGLTEAKLIEKMI